MRAQRPALDYALLGLIAAQSRSGYDLRKIFHDTPLRMYSDSPGSVYPALRRLEANRLIVGRANGGPRRRRAFAITGKGRAAFLQWLNAPLTLEHLARNSGEPELRLAFMSDHLPPAAVRAFLKRLADALDEQWSHIAIIRRAISSQLSLSGALALDLGLTSISARAAWCRRASTRKRS